MFTRPPPLIPTVCLPLEMNFISPSFFEIFVSNFKSTLHNLHYINNIVMKNELVVSNTIGNVETTNVVLLNKSFNILYC